MHSTKSINFRLILPEFHFNHPDTPLKRETDRNFSAVATPQQAQAHAYVSGTRPQLWQQGAGYEVENFIIRPRATEVSFLFVPSSHLQPSAAAPLESNWDYNYSYSYNYNYNCIDRHPLREHFHSTTHNCFKTTMTIQWSSHLYRYHDTAVAMDKFCPSGIEYWVLCRARSSIGDRDLKFLNDGGCEGPPGHKSGYTLLWRM